MQWMIRAVGACVGASVSLSSNIHAKTTKGVSDPVYIAFIAIQCSSLLLSAFLIVDPRDVVRDDGTHLAIIKRTSVKEELKSLGRCFLDKRLLFLLPSMLSCEMALALISTVNGMCCICRCFLTDAPPDFVHLLTKKASTSTSARGLSTTSASSSSSCSARLP